METLSLDGKSFKGQGKTFGGGQLQSSDKSFSGKYAAKCDNQNIYGPGITLEEVSSGDIIEATVWQQTDQGHGGLIFQGLWDGYYKTRNKADRIENDWEFVRLRDTIPPGVYQRQLKIYPALPPNGGVVYFDDLEIKHIKNKEAKAPVSANFETPEINVRIEEKHLNKIKLKRSEAFNNGNLDVGKEDLLPAKLEDGENSMDIQLRLKGDLLDHLQGKKWSFRIVPEEGKAWKGMTEFSVQNSKSRDHLSEWVFHRMLEDEGVLSTKYDFVKFHLNGEFIGIYAYEEHFNNALLYKQQREEGPIFRINEDALWEFSSRGLLAKMSLFESGHLEAFGGNTALKDDEFRAKFKKGQQLLFNYLKGKGSVGDYINVEQMAKFAAIMDVCMAYHGFGATNQRFYYNSVSGKLEPLGYDGFSPDGVKWYPPPMILGEHINTRISKEVYFHKVIQPFHYFLFNDYTFVEAYIKYLDEYTHKDYIAAFMEKYRTELESRSAFINQDYNGYDFKPNVSFKNAKWIQEIIHPSENASIKAYRNDDGSLTFENYHLLPIEILGYGNDQMDEKTTDQLILESFNKATPVRRYTAKPKAKYKYVFCKTLGASKVKRFSIFNWSLPSEEMATVKGDIQQIMDHPLLNVGTDNIIRCAPSLKSLKEDLIIPEGYALRIPAGSNITLEEDVSIVSNGPIFAEGTKEQPITITSSSRGQGLLILNAEEASSFKHCTFQNLKSRNKGSQITDGGLSVYNSKTNFEHCKFEGSRSKDALNLIKSNYSLLNSSFVNINGDAVDANNSAGEIKEAYFDQIGKDAIEVSGGTLTTEKIIVKFAKGAGLNAGRSAKVEVMDGLDISESEIGVQASDLSNVFIDQLKLNQVDQGFVLFQKLASYGSAHVKVNTYETEQVNRLHLIDQEATLLLNGKKMEAN